MKRGDLQKKVRVRRAANLVLFVVDASWSMAAAERIEATKGAVLSLLHDAYQRRDQVGLIVFQREEARIVLPPTSSVELAQQALRNVPVGGKTPLSAGLLAAFRVCTAAVRRNPEIKPLIIILTDGAGNVSVTGMPPQEESRRMAMMIHDAHFRTVIINMEHPAFDRGLAQDLANFVGGPCYTLPELKAEALLKTVRAGAERSSLASVGPAQTARPMRAAGCPMFPGLIRAASAGPDGTRRPIRCRSNEAGQSCRSCGCGPSLASGELRRPAPARSRTPRCFWSPSSGARPS